MGRGRKRRQQNQKRSNNPPRQRAAKTKSTRFWAPAYKRATSEQVDIITEEIFGTRYYCVGDAKKD